MIRALLLVLLAPVAFAQDGRLVFDRPGWPTYFELDPGQSFKVVRKTPGGAVERTVKLLSAREFNQPDFAVRDNPARETFSHAEVVVEIDGKVHALLLRPYQFPAEVAGLRLYGEATRPSGDIGYAPVPDLQRKARLSATAAGEPWGPPMAFPVRQYRWRSSSYFNTWAALVPYNRLYYHRGEDLGAIPDRLDVAALFAGTITAAPPPGGDGSNTVLVTGPDQVRFLLTHMNIETIDPALKPGVAVKAGQVVGKTGSTWSRPRSQRNDPHLHVALKTPTTTLSLYPALVEAYFRDYPDALIPNSGACYFTTVNGEVTLDASRSLARPGRKIAGYQWKLHDGRTVDGPVARLRYPAPGQYSEELIVKADDGSEDRDFAQVRVYKPEPGQEICHGWFHYTPVRDIRPGTPVLFWNRLVKTTGEVTIDFGDGTPPRPIKDELNHAYEKPGLYTATLRAQGNGGPVTIKVRVHVSP